ncbi:unnamed protein product, partial [Boreogadus saida]
MYYYYYYLYSVSETPSRFFNDRHDLQGTEEKLCITYEITADPQTKRWPKKSIWMVFKDWIKKTRQNDLLSQCKRYFINVSNKKKDELEKEKNRQQIKLLADEIRLLKDEATLNKEQRKLTDLHTTLVRQGMIAACPLDSGPPRRGDQGDGGGTLGAYGRMYPTLPLCATDGEYIFPGGCSTPHVPQKGNPSAPPDYANHDAIQIPQQFQHPNPPTQQPPAVRSG